MTSARPRGGTRSLVAGAALVAFLLRFPGLIWPVRADEAGFTLVARHWDPQPDSSTATYFVDRPPPLIALVKASDWIGGPLFIRVVAALGCVLLRGGRGPHGVPPRRRPARPAGPRSRRPR